MAHAVANGQMLYRDIFCQYGPIPTYLQAGAIKIFGGGIFTLQVLSCFVLALAGSLMFSIWRRLFSVAIAILSIGFWIGTTYFFDWRYSLLPWSSDFALLFVVLALYCFVRCRPQSRLLLIRERRVALSPSLILTGLFLGLVFWTRLSLGIATILLLATFQIGRRKFSDVAQTIFGFTLVLLTGILWLVINDSLLPFVDQSIKWPAKWAVDVRPGESGVNLFLFGLLVIGGLGVLVVVATFSLLCFSMKQLRQVSALVVPSALVLLWLRNVIPTQEIYWQTNSFRWGLPGINAILVLWTFALGSFVWLLFGQFKKSLYLTPHAKSQDAFLSEGILFIGAGMVLGAYPVPDRAHLWLVILPVIGSQVALIAGVFRRKPQRIGVTVLVVLFLTSSVASEVGDNFSRSDLKRWRDTPFLDGMLEKSESMEIRKEQISILRDLISVHGQRPILNICQDAFFYVLGQTQQPDPYIIFWGPGKDGKTYFPTESISLSREIWIKNSQPIIFYCAPAEPDVEKLQKVNYQVIRTWGSGPNEWGWPMDASIAVPRTWIEASDGK
jgi:hypothetical protein